MLTGDSNLVNEDVVADFDDAMEHFAADYYATPNASPQGLVGLTADLMTGDERWPDWNEASLEERRWAMENVEPPQL